MQTEPAFRPARIALLIRNSILLNTSSIGIVSAAVGGVLLIVSALDASGPCRQGLHQILYLVVLFVGGLLLTSRSFKDLHDPVRGLFWLLLPASLLEKTLARVLVTTAMFLAGSMLLYLAFSVVSEFVNLLLFGRRHDLFFPFDPVVLEGAAYYVALQAPILLGAVYFRKHVLSKTILCLLGLVLLLALGVAIEAYLVLEIPIGSLDADASWLEGRDPGLLWTRLDGLRRAAEMSGKGLLFGGVPLICWITCYLKLRETER